MLYFCYNHHMDLTLEKITKALQASWREDTCYESNDWSTDNPARGQCVVSCFVVNDYLGGSFQKYRVTGAVQEKHYCNILWNGVRVDTTLGQYDNLEVSLKPVEIDLKGYANCRAKLLSDGDTRRRYEILKAQVAAILDQ